MLLSQLPPWLSRAFARFAAFLDRRTAQRLPLLALGILLASGRRTATSWFRAAGIAEDFRRAYHTIYAVGRAADSLSWAAWQTSTPCLSERRIPAIVPLTVCSTPSSSVYFRCQTS